MRALGLTCGIGSMLIGARAAGFEVVGNIEWRKYYHVRDDQGRNTFTENFPGAFMVHSIDELTDEQIDGLKGVDLVMGHTECGVYSNLRTTNKLGPDSPGDIPLFVEMVHRVDPTYIVMDNLPGSLIGYPVEKWAEELPDYDVFFEWVSNYNYGNSQKNRKRFFLIAAKKLERFLFNPGEFENNMVLGDVIGDLPLKEDIVEINHIHFKDDHEIAQGWSRHHFPQLLPRKDGVNRLTLGELKSCIKDYPDHTLLPYRNLKGQDLKRPGYMKVRLNHHSMVMTGGGAALDNHYRADTLNPLTPRERARIQGCPDDFLFYPLDHTKNHIQYIGVYKQLGKFVPVQFCTYVARQIAAHIQGQPFEASGERLIKPNPHIDAAKKWYCGNVGYGDNQERVCEVCWMKNCSIHPADEPRVFAPPEPAPIAEAEVPSEQVSKKKSRPQNQRASSVTDDEVVNLRRERDLPEDHVGVSKYAERYEGQLIRPDGSYYNRLVRNRYYDPVEKKHPAKTPLHIARWAIQEYTEPGGWVFDPTVGAGTTVVESLRTGRNACGVELEFVDVVLANIRKNDPGDLTWRIYEGDALNLEEYLAADATMAVLQFDLIVNNPPYSGDVRESSFGRNVPKIGYRKDLPNAAHHRENKKYWDFIEKVYGQCINRLRPGGRFVIGVKDMMRNGEPFLLHEMLGDVLSRHLTYERMVLLKHHPTTLFLNTYEKKTGKKPPLYQTILVFRKEAPDDQG